MRSDSGASANRHEKENYIINFCLSDWSNEPQKRHRENSSKIQMNPVFRTRKARPLKESPWKDPDRLRFELELISSRLSLTSLDDWYGITSQEVLKLPSGPSIIKYHKTLPSALRSAFSTHQWKEWLFRKASNHELKAIDKLRRYFDWRAKEIGVKEASDWYAIEAKQIDQSILKGSTISDLLRKAYPEHQWQVWRFKFLPKGFWKEQENVTECFKWLEDQLNVKSVGCWQQINPQQVIDAGGARLLYHMGSLSALLVRFYPEHQWSFQPWKSRSVDKLTVRQEFDRLEEALGIKEKEEWYKLNRSDIAPYYKKIERFSCMYIALKEVYREHDWKSWRFSIVNPKFISSTDMEEMIHFLEKKLNIRELSEWHRITPSQIAPFGSIHLIHSKGGLRNVLGRIYPRHLWNWNKSVPKSSQMTLKRTVEMIFPTFKVEENFCHPELQFESNIKITFDVYVTDLKLAFEYQGEHHYGDIYLFGSLDHLKYRDSYKKSVCAENRIVLIEVPFWWDKSLGSLAATIQKAVPHLPLNVEIGTPIPEQNPDSSTVRNKSKLALCDIWDGKQDLTGW